MGSSPSRLVGRPQGRVPTHSSETSNSFDTERPSKRRKIGNLERPSQNSNGGQPARTASATISPSKFYRRATVAAESSIVEKVASQQPVEFRKALRIDLTKIICAVEEPGDDFTYPLRVKCKFTVSIFYANSENSRDGILRSAGYQIVLKRTQTGDLITKLENGEWRRNIILLQPFVFASEEFFVDRTKDRCGHPDLAGDYSTHDLADGYWAQVTIERVGQEKRWPPLRVLDDHAQEKRHILLHSKFSILVSPERQSRAVPIFFVQRSKKDPSSYSLQFRVQWSLPNQLPGPRKEESPHESDHVTWSELKQDVASLPLSDPIDNSLLPNDMAPAGQHESPAGRARRGRVVDTYNLKALSAQAQGKSPRKRRVRPSDESLPSDSIQEPQISFFFGGVYSAENGTQQQYTFNGLSCPFCGCSNQTINQLRLHLHNEHDNYRFLLRRSGSSRLAYFVEVVKGESNGTGVDGRTFQLGQPRSILDLEKYLNGNASWVKARQGPQHNHWPDHLFARNRPASLSSSSHHSRYSSPNTSKSAEDPVEVEAVSKPLSTREIPISSRKKVLVPRTAKPLFHTITKQVLKPGEQLPDSDDETSESWFYQKHKEIIDDFEDVDVDDKEFFHKWNPYAMEAQKTQSLPDTVISFTDVNADWLAESSTRREKFMAHMSVLILQGAVTQKLVAKCSMVIRQAEAKKEEEHHTHLDTTPHAKQREAYDCICLEHVPLHDRMVCLAEDCKARFFHKACAAKLGIPETIRGSWRCGSCLATASLLDHY